MNLYTKTLGLFFFFAITFSLNAQIKNIGKDATITASSELNSTMSAENLIDGIIGVDNLGEWACNGTRTSWGYIELPWVHMEWAQPQKVDRIVLYDRPSDKENSASVKMTFSDGSELYVRQIPDNGHGKEVLFETKTIDWVK
ncbi:hypothetical protein, partial [uncultured Salegentibacter sp.]|uniref:DUF7402 domain-containing protein n=1 Tax=uncultured Salegentibacter sp. TaxID=259320 RepID=UPI0030DCB77B